MAARSTFCYANTNTMKLTHSEETIKRRQWEIFERVENINSAIWISILNQGGFSSGYSNSTNAPIFYTFTSNEERANYLAGQAAHVREYPDVSGFITPYAQRPYPVISSYSSYTDISSATVCPKADVSKIVSAERELLNPKDLSLYAQVSTYNATFPRSPYKFQSNTDYTNYTKIKKLICARL
jgi:hypothetical protein